MTKRLLCGVYLLAACLGSTVYAADATFYFGFQNPGSLTLKQVPDIISQSIQLNTNWGGVIGARLSTSGGIGFEQSIGVSPNFLDSNASAFNTQSNLMVNIPLHKFVPYGTVGLGFVSTWGESQKSFGTRFTLNYGGGIKLRKILGPLGLRFDLRGYTAFSAFGDSPIFQSQNLNFLEGTVNVFISF
jgi:hypothetical protein